MTTSADHAPAVAAEVVLGAVEALFGAGTTVAPIPGVADVGGTLLRYLPKLSDAWTNGLHLDAAPTSGQLAEALDTWEAFERPGRLRWVAGAATGVADEVRDLVAGRTRDGEPADLVVAARPVFHGVAATGVGPEELDGHGELALAAVGDDPRDWAGFEVLARWIDLDDAPEVWAWRAKRVGNLVRGGRGLAVLARVPAAPVGAAVRLRAPDHRPAAAPVLVGVVHQAHRGRGVATAVLSGAARGHAGPVTVLGDADGHVARAAAALGLAHVADLVEVGPRPDGGDRKA